MDNKNKGFEIKSGNDKNVIAGGNGDKDIKKASDKPENAPASKGGSKEIFKMVVPTVLIVLCAVIVGIMLKFEIAELNSIHGKFVCNNSQENSSYILFDKSGSYTYNDGDSIEVSGSWESGGNILVLSGEDGSTETMFYVDGKYLAFDDDEFLSGNVPESEVFDASFTTGDGTTYIFDEDGKCYVGDEGRNTELGKYITDGSFVVITIDNVAHTYLNCGDGLAPVFYAQA